MNEQRLALNRRRFLECFSAGGFALMPGALMAVAQDAPRITLEMLEAAQKIAGLSFTREQQEKILARLNGQEGPLQGFDALRAADLGSTPPAIVFNPVLPGKTLPSERRPLRRKALEVSMPATDEELAFLPVTHLARLVETRQITPTELTQLYLSRLKRYDPRLLCVVSLPRIWLCVRLGERTKKSPQARIAAPCTAFRGDSKTCSRCEERRRPGE